MQVLPSKGHFESHLDFLVQRGFLHETEASSPSRIMGCRDCRESISQEIPFAMVLASWETCENKPGSNLMAFLNIGICRPQTVEVSSCFPFNPMRLLWISPALHPRRSFF